MFSIRKNIGQGRISATLRDFSYFFLVIMLFWYTFALYLVIPFLLVFIYYYFCVWQQVEMHYSPFLITIEP